jgi:tRNA(Ile)-lysidine synthase TilS/MesJ
MSGSGVIAEIVNEVRSSLERIRHPLKRPLVIGLSGGVDSQVLAHALMQATKDVGPDLFAVHIDHGLRPGSSNDAARVASICEDWGLPCEVVRVEVDAWEKALEQGTDPPLGMPATPRSLNRRST